MSTMDLGCFFTYAHKNNIIIANYIYLHFTQSMYTRTAMVQWAMIGACIANTGRQICEFMTVLTARDDKSCIYNHGPVRLACIAHIMYNYANKINKHVGQHIHIIIILYNHMV